MSEETKPNEPEPTPPATKGAARRFGLLEGLLALAAAGSLAVAGFVVVHRAEYLWSTGGLLVCLVAPLVAALAFAASLFASRTVRVQALLCGVGVVIALYAFEGYAEWQVAEAGAATAAPEGPRNLSRFAKVKELREQGVDAHPLSSGVTVYVLQSAKKPEATIELGGKPLLPLGGISKAQIVMCNESAKWVVYESDVHGFRNPDAAWAYPSLDIATVGDSFTQGLCVEAPDSIVGVVRAKYPKLLNVAMGGYGPLLELATIKEYLPERKPRVVLWFFFENDFENLLHELKQPVLARYLAEPDFRQGLEGLQPEIDKAHRRIVDMAMVEEEQAEKNAASAKPEGMSLGDVVKLDNLRERINLTYQRPPLDKELGALRKVMTEAKRVTSSWGGEILFVLLPDWKTLHGKTPYAPRDGIFRVLDEVGIAHVDAYDTMVKTPDIDTLFPVQRRAMRLVAPGHYNEAGHKLVGELVLSWLAEHKVEPSAP